MGETRKVMQIIPHLGLGGAEIMVENLSKTLSENGYSVEIVSLYKKHSAITARLEEQKVPIHFLDKKIGIDVKILFRLYKLFKQKNPDAIHTHLYAMPYAVIAAIFARIPVKIHTIHTIASKEVSKGKRKISRFFFKYFKVIPVSISPLVKKSVIEEYKVSEKQSPMIYNGLPLRRCLPKNDYNIKKDEINILHIGRFSEPKNHVGLIESFKFVYDKSPNTKLSLIGTGELEEVVRTRVIELGLQNHVNFLGLQANVYPYLNKADIFVLPSLWEGMPITLIEAMATGLPIVATGVGGVPDMIEDNVTGLLVDIDKEQISEAVLKLIKDANLRQKLGSAAKLSSKRFLAQEMAMRYAKLYEK